MKKRANRAGFSLVEVALAMGVAAFALVSMVGLLATGINVDRSSANATVASNLMSAVVDDLRSTPSTATASSLYKIPLPAVGGASTMGTSPTVLYFSWDGAASNTRTANTPFCVAVGFQPPASSYGSQAITARVMVAWPAATGAGAQWPTNYEGSVETVVSLTPPNS